MFDDKTERMLAPPAGLLDLGEEGRSLLRAALKREDASAMGVLADWVEERGYRNPLARRPDASAERPAPPPTRPAAILRVSWDLLRHVLRLPENCHLNAISTNVYFDLDQVAFRVECPDFPPTQEGCPLPVAAPTWERKTLPDGTNVAEFLGWNW